MVKETRRHPREEERRGEERRGGLKAEIKGLS